MKHTPEPWAICPLLSHPFSPCYDSTTGELKNHHGTVNIRSGEKIVASSSAMTGSDLFAQTAEELDANAKRIVECVNACAGVENPCGIQLLIEELKLDAEGSVNTPHEVGGYARHLLSYLSHE